MYVHRKIVKLNTYFIMEYEHDYHLYTGISLQSSPQGYFTYFYVNATLHFVYTINQKYFKARGCIKLLTLNTPRTILVGYLKLKLHHLS